MDTVRHFSLLARYNLWAYERMYEQVDALSDADYRRDLGLFFRSVHGTLNHLLVGEHLLWLERFAHGTSPRVELGAEVEPDRMRLRDRLLDGAARWLPLVAGWPAERFDGTLRYTRAAGGSELELPFSATLAHVFNHSTHHRGQISAALFMLGQPAPDIDLVQLLLQEASAGPR